MPHDVFISHSSKNLDLVQPLLDALEQSRISCWIAPRDPKAGKGFVTQISRAVDTSRLLVLLLTPSANHSSFVEGELHAAVNARVPIFVIRVGATLPAEHLKLLIARYHWYSIEDDPSTTWVTDCVDAIRTGLLSHPTGEVGEYIILEEGELRQASNGLHYRLHRLRHRDLPESEYRAKAYMLEDVDDESRSQFDEQVRRHFRVAAKLGRHQNINLYLHHQWDGPSRTLWVIESRLEGRPLTDLLQNGPLPAAQVLEIMRDVANGLVALHKAGFVRRELNPDSIHVPENGPTVLTDFELTKATDGSPTVSLDGCWLANPYIAPELIHDAGCDDVRVDVFAWAAVLFHAVVGRPWDGPASHGELAAAGLPPEAVEFLSDALDPVADVRPRNMKKVLRAVSRWSLTGTERR